MTPGPRVRWGGVKGEMRKWGWYECSTYWRFKSGRIFKHMTEVKCVTGIRKWRRCCSKETINIQNVIRCPLKRFQSSKLWEIRWSWSEKVRRDGFEARWVKWGVVSVSWRSPSGCGDAIWPTGGRVQVPTTK